MHPCVRLRVMVRRRWRRIRRFWREVREDIQYRHIWQRVKKPAGHPFYVCAACGAESVSNIGGHRDRCPARTASHVDITA